MADRIMTWHFPGTVEPQTALLSYVADRDYESPRVILTMDEGPTGPAAMTIDIQVDGVSIYPAGLPLMDIFATKSVHAPEAVGPINKDGLVKLIISNPKERGSLGINLAVHLELETD